MQSIRYQTKKIKIFNEWNYVNTLKLGLDYLDLEMGTARWELVVIVTRSPGSACRVVILSDAVPIIVERLPFEQSVCRPPAQVRVSTKFPKSQR